MVAVFADVCLLIDRVVDLCL